jgi:hypothetical protein
MQLLEMAHVVVARRFQELGVLGDLETTYVPPDDRDRMIFSTVRRSLDEAQGDCEAVVQSFRKNVDGRKHGQKHGHLGRFLEALPMAPAAVKAFKSKRASPVCAACTCAFAAGSRVLHILGYRFAVCCLQPPTNLTIQ